MVASSISKPLDNSGLAGPSETPVAPAGFSPPARPDSSRAANGGPPVSLSDAAKAAVARADRATQGAKTYLQGLAARKQARDTGAPRHPALQGAIDNVLLAARRRPD